jgi:Tol biopolymer transport system component
MPLGIWGVDVTQAGATPRLISQKLGLYSPDGAVAAYPGYTKETTIVERLADGKTWEIATQGRSPNFTPDSQHVMWTVFDDDAPSDTREEVIWRAKVDGTEAKELLRIRRTSLLAWLNDDKLLMSRRIQGGSDQELLSMSLSSGRETKLLSLPRMRGMTLSPDRRYLVYYVSFEPDAAKNGLWLLDLQAAKLAPQKLPFFGSYRWRDNDRLIYVPFDLDATEHNFFEYNILTGQSRALFPTGAGLIIANSDWRVSPDGRKIVLLAAKGTELDGLWVLDLDKDS